MADTKFKVSTVVLSDNDFNEEKKSYIKSQVKLNYYDFDGLELKMYDHPDKNMVWELHIDGIGKFTLRENDGEYGKYWSWTIEKQQLYFNVKKWLARRWESAPLTITFREAILLDKADTSNVEESDAETKVASDEDVPF